MDQSEAMWPEELCTICYIIPKIHWFLCICMKFEKVNISNNSVWKYHGRLKLLHTSVCFCFFFFFFYCFFLFCFVCCFVLTCGVHFCFDFWGGLYCFNFLSFTLYCFFVIVFLFLLLLLFFLIWGIRFELVRDSSAFRGLFFARAVGRQRALHKKNSEFTSPTLGRHISTLCGNQILFSIRNPYINRFTNHFSIYS
jgi:hypothetical protein